MRLPQTAYFSDFALNRWYVAAAVYFLFLQTAYLLATTIPDPSGRAFLLSYCNHIPLLLALAFLFRKMQAAKTIINVGLLIQSAWLVDFLSRLFFGFYIFKITDYIFNAPLSPASVVSIIDHTLTMFIALALTYKIRPRAITILYSFLYIMALYVITLAFTPPALNVNCVFKACVFKPILDIPQFTGLWPVLVMILTILGYAIQSWLYRWHSSHTFSNKL